MSSRERWRKSSFSGAGDGNCIEIAWRKSSLSDAGNGNCIEVAFRVDAVAIRDSKNPTGSRLVFPQPHWHLLAGITPR